MRKASFRKERGLKRSGFQLFGVMFAGRETPAPDFRDLGNDDETVGVDVTGQTLDPGHLMVGDHAEDDFRGSVKIAAFAVEDGNTAVHPGEDGFPDQAGFRTDDLHLRTAGAQQQDLVQGEGNRNDQQDAVEQIFKIVVHHLRQQDAEVKCPEADGNGDPEILLQNQRGDIHAAGGAAAPHDDAQGNADAHAGEQHVQQGIGGDVDVAQDPVQDFQGHGIIQGGEHGGQGELPSQSPPAKTQHGDVETQDESRQGQTGEPVDHQGNAGGAAGHQGSGKQEQLHGQGI